MTDSTLPSCKYRIDAVAPEVDQGYTCYVFLLKKPTDGGQRCHGVLPTSLLGSNCTKLCAYHRSLDTCTQLLRQRATLFQELSRSKTPPVSRLYANLCEETDGIMEKARMWMSDLEKHAWATFRLPCECFDEFEEV